MTSSPAGARPLLRGDIVLVAFPFTDLSQTKRRPAVVLWANPVQTDFALAFISSKDASHPTVGETAMMPTHPEFSLSGLSLPSKIPAMKLMTLSRSLITRWMGRLGPLFTADLDRALVAALSSNTAPCREHGREDERRRLAVLHQAGGNASVLADLGLVTP